MLKRVAVENYRSCIRTTIDLHPNLSVLIGPNGSGKTNILQAIMFLKKMALEERYSPPRTDISAVVSRIKALFQLRRSEIQLDARFVVSTSYSNNDVLAGSRQKWTYKSANGQRIVFDMPLAIGTVGRSFVSLETYWQYYRHKMGSMKAQRWPSMPLVKELMNVARYCEGFRYYGASQFTNPSSCPASFQIDVEGRHSRVSRFRGHTQVLHSMYSAKKADKNRKYAEFLEVVGPHGLKLIDDLSFREVEISSVDYSVRIGGRLVARKRHKLLVIPQFRIGRQVLSPNQLSEGTFKTLALLFHVLTEESTVLLIEEPEVCVHHGLLSSILELIKSASHKRQMILSTHSDYVLDHVKPENVYAVTFDKAKGTTVRHIPTSMTTKEYSALREYLLVEGNLGEYWREGGLGDRP